MMSIECLNRQKFLFLPACLLALLLSLAGCTTPEKAKAEHVSRGEAFLKAEKFQEASLEFRNAKQIDEKLAAAHWGLARAYEGLQRSQEMYDELRTTIQLDPDNLDARIRLGNYDMQVAGHVPEALAEAEKMAKAVLQKDANNIEGHILMGNVLFQQNQKDQAFAELNRAIELDPKRVESRLALARFYIAAKDMAKAEETYQNAIALNGSSALAHTEYGKFLIQSGRPEAEAELRKAVEVEPTNRASYFVLASFYLVNKRLDKAEEAYKALADLDKEKPEGRAILADFYSAVNRQGEAIRIYQEILSKTPDFNQARYRLTEVLLTTGDAKGAMAHVEELMKRDSHDRQALLLRARVRAQGGQSSDLKAAIEDLKEVLKQEPNSRGGLYFMAQANFSLGLIDQARAFSGELEHNYPDYLPAKLMHVQISLATGDTATAQKLAGELLDKLSKAGPDRDTSPQLIASMTAKAYNSRGSATAQLGNTQAARADFIAARDITPRDPDSYVNLAVVSRLENKADEAVGFYENALSIDPVNFNALSGLMNLYVAQKQADKGIGRLDQVLSTNPNNASLHFLKAQVYGSQQNVQGAETELSKTLEIDPNYIAARSSLGNLFVNTKQPDRALAEYKKIIELRPDNAATYTLMGMLEEARKNWDAAAESYRLALQQDQNAVIAANNLAWLYADKGKGNLDEALRLAQGVVQKNPEVAGFADTLGWVYFKKGLYGAAADQLQKAVALDEAAARKTNGSPSPSYHYHLGLALASKGDKPAAKREIELALSISTKPNTQFSEADDARKALATL